MAEDGSELSAASAYSAMRTGWSDCPAFTSSTVKVTCARATTAPCGWRRRGTQLSDTLTVQSVLYISS
jgi:hypothetical protein